MLQQRPVEIFQQQQHKFASSAPSSQQQEDHSYPHFNTVFLGLLQQVVTKTSTMSGTNNNQNYNQYSHQQQQPTFSYASAVSANKSSSAQNNNYYNNNISSNKMTLNNNDDATATSPSSPLASNGSKRSQRTPNTPKVKEQNSFTTVGHNFFHSLDGSISPMDITPPRKTSGGSARGPITPLMSGVNKQDSMEGSLTPRKGSMKASMPIGSTEDSPLKSMDRTPISSPAIGRSPASQRSLSPMMLSSPISAAHFAQQNNYSNIHSSVDDVLAKATTRASTSNSSSTAARQLQLDSPTSTRKQSSGLIVNLPSKINNNQQHDDESDTSSDSGSVESHYEGKSRYKTELCRSWEETGYCRYADKCQFAHGHEELRHVSRHHKYKSELCNNYHYEGTCMYGIRCCFIHNIRRMYIGKAASQNLELVRFKNLKRLPVFIQLCDREQESMEDFNMIGPDDLKDAVILPQQADLQDVDDHDDDDDEMAHH